MKKILNRYGFTLIETVTAMLIFAIVMVMATGLLYHCKDSYLKAVAKNQLLENARITMEFIINESRIAEQLVIHKYRNTETLYVLDITRGGHTYQIYYDNTENHTDKFYQTVRYGGYSDVNDDQSYTQVLAEYIDDIIITVNRDKEIMYITVKTADKVDNAVVSPIVLYGEVSLSDTPYMII